LTQRAAMLAGADRMHRQFTTPDFEEIQAHRRSVFRPCTDCRPKPVASSSQKCREPPQSCGGVMTGTASGWTAIDCPQREGWCSVLVHMKDRQIADSSPLFPNRLPRALCPHSLR
jgi:hypothetical protein